MTLLLMEALLHLSIGLAVILVLAHWLGRLSARWHLGLVTAEIGVGILLGPTILGRFAPDFHAWLFLHSSEQTAAWHAVSSFCLHAFLFAAGLELEVAQLRRGAPTILMTGIFGTIFPFIAGVAIVYYSPGFWSFPSTFGPVVPAMLAGTLFSISALPVILRVLHELRLFRTRAGDTIIGAAIVDDLIGWIMFGAIVSSISDGFDLGGGHGVLVAFAAGIAVANLPFGKHPLLFRLQAFLLRFCAPVYFGLMLMKTDFAKQSDLTLIVLLLVFSSFAKISGVALGSRISGIPWRESLAIACGMNARGAMSIVLAGTALEAGLLTERLFVAFVCVAVATSVVSAPLMRFLLKPGATPVGPEAERLAANAHAGQLV